MLQKGKKMAVETPARLEQALNPKATNTVALAIEGPKKKVLPKFFVKHHHPLLNITFSRNGQLLRNHPMPKPSPSVLKLVK